MITAWYSLIIGILLSLNGVLFLIFTVKDFQMPNWYIGILILIGLVGIIFGFSTFAKKKKEISAAAAEAEKPEEDVLE
ncbi:MAG: hypothetical protein WCV50_03115 [Patescibacteria group bacterium]|jgi:amino acid transporter